MNCCLITTDYEGKKVIFTESTRLIKKQKHPELGNLGFITGRVNDAIKKPDFVYQDFDRPNERRVHYLMEYQCNNKYRFTKVIIVCNKNPLEVINAFRPDYVKERNKTKLLFGKDIYV